MKNSPKAGKYIFVPAALFYTNHGGCRIYIRYGKFPNRIELLESTKNYQRFRTPDRELLLVANGHYAQSNNDIAGCYDECIDVTPIDDDTSLALGIKMYMYNYPQNCRSGDDSPRNRLTTRKNKYPLILSDSGGFQLATGRLEYIDPYKLIEWYNENSDQGIVLDIPYAGLDTSLHKQLAKIQAKNTNILIENKKEGFELLNVFHGKSWKHLQIYFDACEREDIDRLSIGGTYYGSVLSSLDSIYRLMSRNKKYKHYHILGVSATSRIPLFIKLAKMGIAPLITSDSSSYIQSAVRFTYKFNGGVNKGLSNLDIGYNSYSPSISNILPCSCPVCSSIKYMDILSCTQHRFITTALLYHNMFVMNNYCNSMYDLCMRVDDREYQSAIKKQLLNVRPDIRNETIASLEFLSTIEQDGYKAAAKRFNYYLNSGIRSVSKSKSTLFGSQVSITEQTAQENIKDITRIVDIYKGKRKGTHGKEVKKHLMVHAAKLGTIRIKAGSVTMTKLLKKKP